MSLILESIRSLGRGLRGRKPLTQTQAYEVMRAYLLQDKDQDIEPIGDDQMAMMLMLMRVNEETPAEIAGFIQAFQEDLEELKADIDWPCYAGKRDEAPWHGLAAKILANNGYKVLLHGGIDKSARQHISDYLSDLDITQACDMQDAQRLLETNNIAYLPLQSFAPKAQQMLLWKNRYGLRTPINTMARGLNPGRATLGIRGSFHPGYGKLHAQVDQLVDRTSLKVVSFKGQHGEAEFNPSVSQSVWLSTHAGVEDFYLAEAMRDDLCLPSESYLSQSRLFASQKQTPMHIANVIVSTMTVILYAQLQDLEQAQGTALTYWQEYCDQN